MTSTERRSTRDLIRLAALRNCEGASFLAEDELEEAVANFAIAYRCIGQAIARDADASDQEESASEANSDSDNDDSDDDGNAIPAESVDRYHFILDTSHVAWYAASRTQEEGVNHRTLPDARDATPSSNFISKEAMVFHPESASDPEETPFFEAVIMFNLALTFHQNGLCIPPIGMATTSSQRKCLCRGLYCYSQCLKLLKEGNYNHSTSSIQANRIVEAHVLIASLNNKAQALFSMGEYDDAFWILQELGSVLNNSAGDPPGFQGDEVRGLEGTMELLNEPEMTAIEDAAMAAMDANNNPTAAAV